MRGNHYLSDVVGLLPVAALFSGSRRGPRLGRRGRPASSSARWRHQVRADGCDHEASIPYHRLVCELFVCGAQARRGARARAALAGRSASGSTRCSPSSPTTRAPTGSRRRSATPTTGASCRSATTARRLRDHRHLFRQAGREPYPRRAAATPPTPTAATTSCAAASSARSSAAATSALGGVGGHAHNDQLSFELALGEQPLVVDPGALPLHGRSRRAQPLPLDRRRTRRCRSTAPSRTRCATTTCSRSTDRTHAQTLRWEPAPGGGRWAGRHSGYERAPRARRPTRARSSSTAPARELRIEDVIESAGAHELTLELPARARRASVDGTPMRRARELAVGRDARRSTRRAATAPSSPPSLARLRRSRAVADGPPVAPLAARRGLASGSCSATVRRVSGIEQHHADWEQLAELDPMWAILSSPEQRFGGWDDEEFFATGEREVAELLRATRADRRPAAAGARRSTSAAASAASRARSRHATTTSSASTSPRRCSRAGAS